MKYVCVWLIRLYQIILSPLKRTPSCRFTPSCSPYAAEAFMKSGFFVGLWLTVRRIFRCNPFCAGGYDPVPEKRKKIPKYARPGNEGKDAPDAEASETVTKEQK